MRLKRLPAMYPTLYDRTRGSEGARRGSEGVRNCEISIKFTSKTRNGQSLGTEVVRAVGEGDMSIVSGH